jgi:hypothetical protein
MNSMAIYSAMNHATRRRTRLQFSSSANQASCGGSSGCAHRGGGNFEWFVAMVMVEAATTTCHTVKSARE